MKRQAAKAQPKPDKESQRTVNPWLVGLGLVGAIAAAMALSGDNKSESGNSLPRAKGPLPRTARMGNNR